MYVFAIQHPKVMKTVPLHHLRIIMLLSTLTTISIADDDDHDSAAMAALAAAFNPNPFTISTNSSPPYCGWSYVGCDRLSRRVAIINLGKGIDKDNVSGYLPDEIGSLSHLEELSINQKLSGIIPRLDNLTSLIKLSLDGNNFNGFAPGFFQGLPTSIRLLSLGSNPFTAWEFPREWSRLTNLQDFSCGYANLTGDIPGIIFESFSHLFMLSLPNNNLSGTISWLKSITMLVSANLNSNRFTGTIPDLSNNTILRTLSLENNQLTGTVPLFLSSSSSPTALYLSNNKLQGPFPQFLLDIQARVHGNSFCTETGDPCDTQVMSMLEIAGALEYPLLLYDSWKGNDVCRNWSFVMCNSRNVITEVNLSGLHFGGIISPSFADLSSLEFLYLSHNNLTGFIPKELTTLRDLQVIDVSNNNLTGVIPPFGASVTLVTKGNHLQVSSTRKAPTGRRNPKVVLMIVLVIATSFTAIFLFILGAWFTRHVGIKNIEACVEEKAFCDIFADLNKLNSSSRFLEVESLDYEGIVQATDNFNSCNKLGQGGFGLVYKGKLENGQEIAVKRLWRPSIEGPQEFMNEVMVISKLQHKNLVRLLGCSIKGDEQMLVYEYMENRSLDFVLFDPQKRELLNWRKRFHIIEGICYGLMYLHRDSRPRIIHRDLKASNILLDKDFNPKISDFGIAKIFNSTGDLANTRKIMGTYGYMPPEYIKKGQFSEKSDIFSFGVLILEIISGKRSTEAMNDENSMSIIEHAWRSWSAQNILDFMDPMIRSPCYEQEIIRCVHIGLLCVQEFMKDRPVIATVISMLRSEIGNIPTPKRLAFVEEETKNKQIK